MIPISLTDYAANYLRESILTGKYHPGQRLVAMEIADELGISRTPVMNAIAVIVSENLAENAPRHCAVVRQFTQKEMSDILETRYMIEFFATPLVIQNLDSHREELAELKELAAKFTDAPYMSYMDANKLDTSYHNLFVKMSGNDQLLKLYKLNWSIGITYHAFYAKQVPLTSRIDDFNDHKLLVSHIENRDVDGALTLIARMKAANMELVDVTE